MKKTTNPLWGGRFEKKNSSLLSRINNSINFDHELALYDIKVNRVYATALAKAKILSNLENKKIQKALNQIEDEIVSDRFSYKEDYEDIHMNIEMSLKKKIGKIAGKIHTGRSRNDQVATDFKMWVLDKTKLIINLLNKTQNQILVRAKQNVNIVMPGFTHTQNAQPISLSHYFMSIFEMFERDKERFKSLVENNQECPLGSGALAGTNFYSIDRNFIAKKLGFKKPTANSLDSVSDRDFAVEFMANISILSMHISRVSEDFILWSSNQFNFIKFPDSLCTGSSIMPQKKNPDAAELMRSKTGRIFGSLINILTILKGLPLGYSKDLQEDKEPLFDAFNNIFLVLEVFKETIKSIKINKYSMKQSSNQGFTTSTDLADWMVKNLKMSFREAHNKTGKIVLLAEKNEKKLHELSIDSLKKIEPKINKTVYEILSPENSVINKNSQGGTSFQQVKKAIKKATERLKK